jgi:gamma-glutamyltranspeptidase/glutathione hydrolase
MASHGTNQYCEPRDLAPNHRRRRRGLRPFGPALTCVIAAAAVTMSATIVTAAPESLAPSPFGSPTASRPNPAEGITAVRGDRSGNWLEQTRSEVVARNGLVATSQPLAAQAGLDVLQRGGNAADAAVAAAAVLSVVEPMAHGLGGDSFVLYYSAKKKKLYGLNASGWAPSSWTPEYFGKRGFGPATGMPSSGPDTVTVPGALDGWFRLNKRFGSERFSRLLAPAVRVARDGFGVTERIHRQWRSNVHKLQQDADASATYLPEGDAPNLYSVFSNPDLASAFRTIQVKGRKAMYGGDIGKAIVRKVRAEGGTMQLSDLEAYRSEWVEPISTNYHGYDVLQMPPNTQGFATLEMLNILEVCTPELGYDLSELGPRSPQFWHLMVEAKKLAFSDLNTYNGDPRFSDVPTKRLISKEYARSLCDRIDPQEASKPAVGGDIRSGTVYVAAADRWGNMVSFISSVYHEFGSGLGVPGYGFTLQDRGASFSLEEGHPNVVAPRKRPFHTIIPAFVMKDQMPVLAFGNMGGSMQPQGQVQELVNMIDLGMNVQAAGDAARFRHNQEDNSLQLESGLHSLVGEELARMGHDVEVTDGTPMGGYQGILFEPFSGVAATHGRHSRTPLGGVYRGGSDLRKDGQAVGW